MDDSPFKDLRLWQLLVQKSEAPKMIESKARQAIPPKSNRRLKTSSRMTPWENHNHYQNDREIFLAVNQRFYKLQRSGCAQDVVCQYRGELLTYMHIYNGDWVKGYEGSVDVIKTIRGGGGRNERKDRVFISKKKISLLH